MIPLADCSRRPVAFPAVTVCLIAIHVVAFDLELLGGDEFVLAWSATTAAIVAGRGWLTAMFPHAGILHIPGNMVLFWAFARSSKMQWGGAAFSSLISSAGLWRSPHRSTWIRRQPSRNLGASGAIAAAMGALPVRYPHGRSETLVPIGPFLTLMPLPAPLLIGVSLLALMLNEAGSLVDGQSDGVAIVAHLAGALFGATAAGTFSKSRALEDGGPPWEATRFGRHL